MQSNKLKNLLLDYFIEIVREVKKIAAAGRGRRVLGKVANRPEDVEISIDGVGEKILEELLKKHRLSAIVFSEPEKREIKFTVSGQPKLYGSLDPFDGSVLFLKGFEHHWWSALSFYNEKRQPLATGIVDILNEKLYLSVEQENYIISNSSFQKKKLIPSGRKSLKGDLVLASYLMSSQYSGKFLDVFRDLIKRLHPRALLYPYGGSFIYAYLAAGLVDAYVMFDEPRSEIDPGFPIAKRAGCPILEVNPDGSFVNYQFIPGRHQEKVDFLVAACTLQLAKKLISYYLKHKTLAS